MTHEIDLSEIELIETDVTQATKQMTLEINAHKTRNTKLIKANNTKALAKIRSETKALIEVKEAEAYSS